MEQRLERLQECRAAFEVLESRHSVLIGLLTEGMHRLDEASKECSSEPPAALPVKPAPVIFTNTSPPPQEPCGAAEELAETAQTPSPPSDPAAHTMVSALLDAVVLRVADRAEANAAVETAKTEMRAFQDLYEQLREVCGRLEAERDQLREYAADERRTSAEAFEAAKVRFEESEEELRSTLALCEGAAQRSMKERETAQGQLKEAQDRIAEQNSLMDSLKVRVAVCVHVCVFSRLCSSPTSLRVSTSLCSMAPRRNWDRPESRARMLPTRLPRLSPWPINEFSSWRGSWMSTSRKQSYTRTRSRRDFAKQQLKRTKRYAGSRLTLKPRYAGVV